jgi:pyocin large subunit-like protein
MWAANKRHSAEDNAQYQFGKNGADFAAASEDDYVTKVHAFVDNPPASAETINRKNGDRLIYDPKANVFAVVTKEGAPRTMFKPRDGAAYWAQQKDSVAKGEDDYRSNTGSSRRSAKRSNGDDNG